MSYYEENDLKRIGEMKALAPEEFTAWANRSRQPKDLNVSFPN
jgi:hypothetical protein